MKPGYGQLQQIRKWAKRGNNRKILDLWKEHPQLVHKADAYGQSALHYAAQNGQESTVRLLLRLGAIPDAQALSPSLEHPRVSSHIRACVGQTALHFAAVSGHLQVVNLLLETEGVDVERRDSSGRTPFLLAVKMGRKEVVEELIKSQAAVHVSDSHGLSALHLACIFNQKDILDFLLNDSRIGINLGDNHGNTSLHYGVLNDFPNIVNTLLAQPNVNLNAYNSKRQTPLLLRLVESQLS